jgi:hypothetical protein
MNSERVEQRLAISLCRTETEIGGVLIREQVVAELVRQVEAPTAGVGRAVHQRDAYLTEVLLPHQITLSLTCSGAKSDSDTPECFARGRPP